METDSRQQPSQSVAIAAGAGASQSVVLAARESLAVSPPNPSHQLGCQQAPKASQSVVMTGSGSRRRVAPNLSHHPDCDESGGVSQSVAMYVLPIRRTTYPDSSHCPLPIRRIPSPNLSWELPISDCDHGLRDPESESSMENVSLPRFGLGDLLAVRRNATTDDSGTKAHATFRGPPNVEVQIRATNRENAQALAEAVLTALAGEDADQLEGAA